VPEVKRWLEEYLADYERLYGRKPQATDPLLPWNKTLSALSTAFQRACKLAGIEGLQLRDIRADFATRVVDRLKGNVGAAQRFTGHRDPKTLMRIYYRLTPEKAADMLRPDADLRHALRQSGVTE